jgi:formate dehydrogenase subunit beta
MFVQGAKAVSSITRLGKGKFRIAAILRPCEIRATIELAKLGQVDMDNIVLFSMDCPGVMKSSEFLKDPDKNEKLFYESAKKFDDKIMRPVCKICDKSSMVAGDIHIGIHGAKKDNLLFITNGKKGEETAKELGINPKDNIKTWEEKVNAFSQEKLKKRKKVHSDLKAKVGGIDNLVETFSHCINCHNCMRVCPVCICRLCYFDSDKVKHTAQDYLERAESKGSMRFLPDTTLFHMGRMMHMSISCVSCGACEDACSVEIPVGLVFSMIADETQKVFDYVSGRSIDEKIPLVAYKEEELTEVEDAHD